MELNRLIRRAYTFALPGKLRAHIERMVKGPFPRIYARKHFIFIHIPKTAGKSINKAVGVSGARHLKLCDYEKLLGREALDNFFIFTVVRHPLDRLESAWSYMLSGGNHSSEDLAFCNKWVKPLRTLDQFIIHALGKNEVALLGKFRPQSDFLKWQDGTFNQSLTICRFENLEKDLTSLPTHVLNATQLPHINASRRMEQHLSPEARRIVKEFYQEDFDRFQYDNSF